jgi:hypothetical protein
MRQRCVSAEKLNISCVIADLFLLSEKIMFCVSSNHVNGSKTYLCSVHMCCQFDIVTMILIGIVQTILYVIMLE